LRASSACDLGAGGLPARADRDSPRARTAAARKEPRRLGVGTGVPPATAQGPERAPAGRSGPDEIAVLSGGPPRRLGNARGRGPSVPASPGVRTRVVTIAAAAGPVPQCRPDCSRGPPSSPIQTRPRPASRRAARRSRRRRPRAVSGDQRNRLRANSPVASTPAGPPRLRSRPSAAAADREARRWTRIRLSSSLVSVTASEKRGSVNNGS
jgi:hypothetical protein